jgi:hypothetical protein
MKSSPEICWPEGKDFVFTIFDDPDAQTLSESRLVYGFLADLGFRTTKAVWPIGPLREVNSPGETCANPAYRAHVQELQERGFEIGFHNAAPHGSTREETIEALQKFKEYFGHYPASMANHYNTEAIYWGPARLTDIRRGLYRAITLNRNTHSFAGHVEGHPYYWGDVCRQRVRYCRNFVFREINTLRVCPSMPYHDPLRPWVRSWFAAAEGHDRNAAMKLIGEANQDKLEAERGACILYTHFAHGFVNGGKLDSGFRNLMTRLSRKNGWFVPASSLLDHLRQQMGDHTLTARERSRLEWRWLSQKLVYGTS